MQLPRIERVIAANSPGTENPGLVRTPVTVCIGRRRMESSSTANAAIAGAERRRRERSGQTHAGGVRRTPVAKIEAWYPPYEFVDIQVKGPYKLWRHIHQFHESQYGTRITDIVKYILPSRTIRPVNSSRTGRG